MRKKWGGIQAPLWGKALLFFCHFFTKPEIFSKLFVGSYFVEVGSL
jgi:hypothetical protein